MRLTAGSQHLAQRGPWEVFPDEGDLSELESSAIIWRRWGGGYSHSVGFQVMSGGLKSGALSTKPAQSSPPAAEGGHDVINPVGVAAATLVLTGGFPAPPPGSGPGRPRGGRRPPGQGPRRARPADPPRAPFLPRRPRAAGALKSPIRQIESINYEGNNLAAPRGAAAERSRGIRPQIALSLPK